MEREKGLEVVISIFVWTGICQSAVRRMSVLQPQSASVCKIMEQKYLLLHGRNMDTSAMCKHLQANISMCMLHVGHAVIDTLHNFIVYMSCTFLGICLPYLNVAQVLIQFSLVLADIQK